MHQLLTAARHLVLLPLYVAFIAFLAFLTLIVVFVEIVAGLSEKRRPNFGAMLMFFCTCPESGGPAGDYRHHHRDCRLARFGGPEDSRTGWVTFG